MDWFNLAANSLWIFALVLVLSVLSFARWEAFTQGRKLKDVLHSDRWVILLNTAGIFFCGGLSATSDTLWEMILWWGFLVLFGVQIGVLVFSKRKPS
jgi:hypothetical protein